MMCGVEANTVLGISWNTASLGVRGSSGEAPLSTSNRLTNSASSTAAIGPLFCGASRSSRVSTHTVEIEIPESCDVDRAGETVEIDVSEDEYVLDAATEMGIDLPASCRQGWCTTCAADLLDGEVDQSDSQRYYDVDEAASFTLICTATPQSPLHIRACQHDAILDHRAEHDLPPGTSKQ
jgi:ferredoxin